MKKIKPDTRLEIIDGKKVYFNTLNGKIRRKWWAKARTPGEVRKSRMPGGSGYRGDKMWATNNNSMQSLEDAYD